MKQRDGMILLEFNCQCKHPCHYTAERLVLADHPPYCNRCWEDMQFCGAKRLVSKGDWVWLKNADVVTREGRPLKWTGYQCKRCKALVFDGSVPKCDCDKPEEKP